VERRSSDQPTGGAMPSPGMLERHYAPRAPLTVYDVASGGAIARLVQEAAASIAQGHRVGIMAADEDRAALSGLSRLGASAVVSYLGSERNLPTVASRLYASMRELDGAGVDRIFVRSFPGDDGLAVAIRDRLRRAAS
jgi:L-threonylcarbamoyladenylate synthase